MLKLSLKLTDHVAKDKKVTFLHYQEKNLWYITDGGLTYSIPVEDTGNGIFLPTERSVYHMKWIRKALETIKQAHKAQQSEQT